jgi:hypothetical protein
MTPPHPSDDDFADAYSPAWTSEPAQLPDFFGPDGSYTDIAMGATYQGREEIARFHRWMLKFAPDSAIDLREDVCHNVVDVGVPGSAKASHLGALSSLSGSSRKAGTPKSQPETHGFFRSWHPRVRCGCGQFDSQPAAAKRSRIRRRPSPTALTPDV